MEQITEALLPLVGTVVAALIGWAATAAARKWGIDIEAKHRDALHSAIMSGVLAALDRGADRPAAVIAGLAHAQKSVPDALSKLKPSQDTLKNIAQAKVQVALGDAVERVLK